MGIVVELHCPPGCPGLNPGSVSYQRCDLPRVTAVTWVPQNRARVGLLCTTEGASAIPRQREWGKEGGRANKRPCHKYLLHVCVLNGRHSSGRWEQSYERNQSPCTHRAYTPVGRDRNKVSETWRCYKKDQGRRTRLGVGGEMTQCY